MFVVVVVVVVVVVLILTLSVGQAGEAWETSNRQRLDVAQLATEEYSHLTANTRW
jgi:hypothetical protein